MGQIIIESKVYGRHIVLIDDELSHYLKQYKWHISKGCSTFYAIGSINGKQVKMHRLIMGAISPKVFCDHCDGNGLNNQRNNIRLCTNSENQKNKKASGSSKYLGVSWHTSKIKYYRKKTKDVIHSKSSGWLSAISVNGKQTHIGKFYLETDAAKAYNDAALKYHGEFARLNII